MRKSVKAMVSWIATLSLLLGLFSVSAITTSAARSSIKTRAEAVAWLNAQNNATYDFNGANGTQCVEFVKAYVNWLINGNAWSDCWASTGWGGATGDGHTIWQNPIWKEFGWTVYPNTADFMPQPGDIFSAGDGYYYSHTGVVISSNLSTAVVADANARNGEWSDGDPVLIHNVTWRSAGTSAAYGVNYFIRPIFADSPVIKTPTISFDKSSYILGDTITVSWAPSPSDSNLSHYWIAVYGPDGKECSGFGKVERSKNSYSFTTPGVGVYTVKIMATPYGSVSGEGSLIDTKSIEIKSKPVTYTISYNANGGSGAPSSQTKTHDVALTLSSTVPTRSGYTFLGWSTSSAATSATYQAGGKFTTNANTTLYAVWAATDTTPPVISYIGFYDVTEDGYKIKVTATDNVGVVRVAYPTWTEANGQDDLLWKDAYLDGNDAYCEVTIKDHNNEIGRYITHIYAYDASGNSVCPGGVHVDVLTMDTPVKTTEWNGHIYAFYDVPRSWENAKEICEELGGHLVTVNSAAEQAFLIESFGEAEYWLGATDELQEGQWQWVTGEDWGYTNWATNQPDNWGTGQQYAVTTTRSDYYGWDDVAGFNTAFGFVLEIEPDYTPTAVVTYNDTEYLLFDISIPWTEAKVFCETLDGHLATITSAGEQQVVLDLMASGSKGMYLLGATDQAEEGVWRWITGETWSYSNWDTYAGGGEPNNNARVGEDYLENYRETGKWNDKTNALTVTDRGFICERKIKLMGDIVADGTLNTFDALILFAAASGQGELTDAQRAVADMNGDGTVNMMDALRLFKQVSGQ